MSEKEFIVPQYEKDQNFSNAFEVALKEFLVCMDEYKFMVGDECMLRTMCNLMRHDGALHIIVLQKGKKYHTISCHDIDKIVPFSSCKESMKTTDSPLNAAGNGKNAVILDSNYKYEPETGTITVPFGYSAFSGSVIVDMNDPRKWEYILGEWLHNSEQGQVNNAIECEYKRSKGFLLCEYDRKSKLATVLNGKTSCSGDTVITDHGWEYKLKQLVVVKDGNEIWTCHCIGRDIPPSAAKMFGIKRMNTEGFSNCDEEDSDTEDDPVMEVFKNSTGVGFAEHTENLTETPQDDITRNKAAFLKEFKKTPFFYNCV